MVPKFWLRPAGRARLRFDAAEYTEQIRKTTLSSKPGREFSHLGRARTEEQLGQRRARAVRRVDYADQNVAVRDLGIVELGSGIGKSGADCQRDQRREDGAEHRQLVGDDAVR